MSQGSAKAPRRSCNAQRRPSQTLKHRAHGGRGGLWWNFLDEHAFEDGGCISVHPPTSSRPGIQVFIQICPSYVGLEAGEPHLVCLVGPHYAIFLFVGLMQDRGPGVRLVSLRPGCPAEGSRNETRNGTGSSGLQAGLAEVESGDEASAQVVAD